MKIDNKKRKFLKSKAHSLKPVVFIGKDRINESVIKAIEHSVESHELIKIRFNQYKDEKTQLIEKINCEINTQLIGLIGNIAIIFRQNKDINKRKYFID